MRNHLRLGLVLAVAVSGACVAACGGDDTADPTGAGGSGGSGGATGTAGKGGATGTAGKGGGSTGGTAGSAGSGGKATGGTAGGGGSVTDSGPTDGKADAGDCGSSGVIRTLPTVPAAIAAPAGVTLVGGYRASGEQIYTCTPSPVVDAGTADDAAAADAAAEGAVVPAVTGTWVNTAVAVLYGDNCTKAADHSYTGTTPTWAAVPDGSKVLALRDKVSPAPTADGGDGAVTDIPWVLLKATSNSGEGIFTNVTYVHRTDTKGGVGPSGTCLPGDASPPQRVAYLATYYFYTGGNSEGGTSEGGSEASSNETSVPIDASLDVSLPIDASLE
jgi:Protein of unknown function (DUF3455)